MSEGAITPPARRKRRLFLQRRDRNVITYIAGFIQNTVLTVTGVMVECRVRDDAQFGYLSFNSPYSGGDQTFFIISLRTIEVR